MNRNVNKTRNQNLWRETRGGDGKKREKKSVFPGMLSPQCYGNIFVTFIASNNFVLMIQFFLFCPLDNEDWGGMCAAGKRQSPVDLAHEAAIKGEYPGFIFQSYDAPMKSPIVVNNGHSSK